MSSPKHLPLFCNTRQSGWKVSGRRWRWGSRTTRRWTRIGRPKKGLCGTEHRERLYLVSGDAEREGPGGETQAPLFEVLPGDWDGPEVECERVEKALVLRDLAREVLDERERKIVFAILFEGYSRREVGEELGLTSQRVSQIFLDAVKRLETDPNNPFTSEDIQEQEGGDQ